jgi:hypothetical protein
VLYATGAIRVNGCGTIKLSYAADFMSPQPRTER